MFLVQIALWVSQFSLFALTIIGLYKNVTFSDSLKDFDYTDLFLDTLKFGIFSTLFQFLLWCTYQHINIIMN